MLLRLGSIVALTATACAAASEPPPSVAAPTASAPSRGEAAPRPAGTGPVIVELFTSQGCSSCPPADRVLSELATAGALDARAVVPLAFHVDYWNQLGWADPFSRPAWSERQRDYASARGDDRVYTPQLVIGGHGHVVGSDRAAVRARIAAAPAPDALPATISWTAGAATVTATAPAAADAWVAIYEDDLATTIARGENAGLAARNDHVVRALVRVAAAGRDGTATVALDPSWRRLGAVAFAAAPDKTIIASRGLASR